METHYYFIFAIVVIVLQCLLAIFNRTLRWLWVDKHCPQSKKWLTLALFTASNAVLFCYIKLKLRRKCGGFSKVFRPSKRGAVAPLLYLISKIPRR